MPGYVLTTASSIICPHGGNVQLSTANAQFLVEGMPALLETDIHIAAGCPFTLPLPKYSPCVRVQWAGGAARINVNGTPVLVTSSIGQCFSAEGIIQGVAIIVNTQQKIYSM